MATFSPKKAVNSNRYCSVPQCTNKASEQREISFHSFPQDGQYVFIENAFGDKEKVDRKKAWIKALRIGKKVTSAMVVCSMHFTRDDYLHADTSAQRRKLKKTAVPSANLPSSSVDVKTQYKKRASRRRHDKVDLQDEGWASTSTEIDSMATTAAESLLLLAEGGTHTIGDSNATPARPTTDIGVQTGNRVETRDFGCQVTSGDFQKTFDTIVDTKRKLRTVTGIPSFEVLKMIIGWFSSVCPPNNRQSMSNGKKVMLTFVKLKLNWSFVLLSILFGGTPTTCSNVFSRTLGILSQILKTFIYWPTKFEVMENLPKCFSKYRKVRVVLDCTEIKTFRPKCTKCRIMSYSHYKGNHTIKYLLGVTPAGMISFLSRGYGGRASDKVICNQSELLDKVDPYIDEIMVDKGFLIKKECEERNIGLVHPPFLRKKFQFSKEEALLTSDIAKARVHVERAIQRVKYFKIASETMPWKLLHLADDIMIVLCAITNLSSPILGDDKF